MHIKNLLFAVLALGALNLSAQDDEDRHFDSIPPDTEHHSDGHPKFPWLKIAEGEFAYSPDGHQFMVNTNGLVKFDLIQTRCTWFAEYNFTHGFKDYSFTVDPKIFGPLHASFSFENDLFGIHPGANHVQSGLKLYMQDIAWFRKPFLNFNIGCNYSVVGSAEHRIGGIEATYSFLTNPIWVRKGVGIIFQSSARIREGHDYFLFQGGIDLSKWRSNFVVGTGKVYEGKVEFFIGYQYSFVPNHNKFALR
ncbi:MAG: hypothetical protein KBB62_00020 [Candidatus Pacebacteria bacterium]|nr:hypothetical protein [Candidatus Paceibacterota bacterium]